MLWYITFRLSAASRLMLNGASEIPRADPFYDYGNCGATYSTLQTRFARYNRANIRAAVNSQTHVQLSPKLCFALLNVLDSAFGQDEDE